MTLKPIALMTLILSLPAFAGPLVGGGQFPDRSIRLEKELIRENLTILASCTISPAPGKIVLINSDGTRETADSLISEAELDAAIQAAAEESVSGNFRKSPEVVYGRDSRSETVILSGKGLVRTGPATEFLKNTVNGLCSGLH